MSTRSLQAVSLFGSKYKLVFRLIIITVLESIINSDQRVKNMLPG